MTKRKVLIIFLVVVGVFAIINLIWFFSVGYKYIQYEKGMDICEDEESSVKYSKEVDGYLYRIKPAGYLSFSSGFLSVSEARWENIFMGDENGNDTPFFIDENGEKQYIDDYRQIDFYYWTSGLSAPKYGIMYWSTELDAQILFDSDLNVLNGEDIGYQEIFQDTVDSNRETIVDLMERASEMWGLEY